jgi:hypothetical protein
VVYTATSDDSGDDVSGGVTYSLGGADAAAFLIDAQTGEVTLVANPNAESKSSYAFTVIATDAAGNTGSQAVTLNIDNTNEFPILFSDDNSNVVGVQEGLDENDEINVDVDASDADFGTTITYSLVASADGGAYTGSEFKVDAVTGQVSAGSTPLVFDPEDPANNMRTIYVQATSSDGSFAVQSYDLVIEPAPVPTSAQYEFNGSEYEFNGGSGGDVMVGGILDFDSILGGGVIETSNLNLFADYGYGILEENEDLMVNGIFDQHNGVFTVGAGIDTLMMFDADGAQAGAIAYNVI